jgi:hypothetical protein
MKNPFANLFKKKDSKDTAAPTPKPETKDKKNLFFFKKF